MKHPTSTLACLALACAAIGMGTSWAGDAATLVLMHGNVWTENPAQPEAQAVALAGSRVLAVGSDAQLARYAKGNTRVIDLKGRRVVPGFNDSHVHFLQGGSALSGVQLGDADTPAEFSRRIGAYARTLPKGAWIGDGNWDHQRWKPAELPTHQLIDEVTPDNPVMVWRLDGHMVLVNALAMKLAGLDRHTPDVAGGEIVRDAQGEPTGILKDEAVGLVARVIPPPTTEQDDRAMRAALAEAARHGVTSVHNMAESPEDEDGARRMQVFERFLRSGELSVRIYNSTALRRWNDLAELGIQSGFGDPMLRIGNLKSFADGALGSTTALMNAPYDNRPDYRGIANGDLLDPERMHRDLLGAVRAGLQPSIHAIGDRAIHDVLDLYARIRAEVPGDKTRFRIEHAQHVDPADFARFAQLGVVASMQPYHAIDDGRWAERYIGHERARSSYAWRSMLDAGATTLWESFEPGASLCHGFSATPVFQLTRHALGVIALEREFARFEVRPQPGDLQWAQGSMPTVRGPIHVNWRRTQTALTLEVSHPPSCRPSIIAPQGYVEVSSTRADGRSEVRFERSA